MDHRTVKHDANRILNNAAYDPKKLALYYASATAIISLVCSALSYLLGLAMDHTGGLSGLALRSMLGSGQVVLSLLSTLVMPLFQMGLVYCALGYSKEESVSHRSLLEGFRRWGAVLRLNVLLILILAGMVMVCIYIAALIFTFSSFSDGLYKAMQPILNDPSVTEVTDEMIYQMLPHMSWLFVLLGVALLVVGLPFYYRYRMSEFALMDGAPGALVAVRQSKVLSRNRRWGMFKLDLSFWWFYLAQLLISLIAYGHDLLTALGVKLPISANASSWIFYIAALAIQTLFTWQFAAYYQTACALYYKRLKESVMAELQMPKDE
nr:DUF975 family protein [Oscillospiraceae bacterium]MBQ8245500.1 DUF975 family protein [Oscillospiraceae bacterium]